MLNARQFEGEIGNRQHVTQSEEGVVPLSAIAHLSGVKGEVPGQHRNRQGEHWDEFLADVREHGIKSPIFVTVDYNEEPKISEGNHRRDAAVELGHTEVPVEVRYFGHAQQQGTLIERSR